MNKRRRYLAKRRRAQGKRPRYLTVSFNWRDIDSSWLERTPGFYEDIAKIARSWADYFDEQIATEVYDRIYAATPTNFNL